ncbi:MAG: 6-carboxytetrahydropterin synthase [Bacteroidetes bacterium]|nr:6-carboxytetrahydropterin synthase [Bacteroidota bacterium]
MVRLTRREHFNAAHRLFRPEYSDEKNLEVFGKCSNPNWHGHNYTLYITVEGEVDPETGFVANLKQLSQLIRDLVINQLDHKNINIEVGFMRGKLASTENLAIGIWEELAGPVAGLGTSLYAVRVEETENNAAEYLGNKTNNQ